MIHATPEQIKQDLESMVVFYILMIKIVIIFYSRDGHTRLVAESLAKMLSCDIFEITEPKSRKGLFGFLRSGMEAIKKKSPPINPLNIDINQYDIVLMGTPIWAGTNCSPLNTFIEQYGKSIKKFALFSLRGGSATPIYASDISKVLQKQPIASMDLVQKGLKSSEWQNNLKDFVAKLQ